jgi:predicted DNA-binding antitoxin AbrB/MazE fold protein
MIKTGRGVYKDGNLKLLDPIDLKEGKLVKILVTEIDQKRSGEAKKRQLKLLKKGIDMGKIEVFTRTELHER